MKQIILLIVILVLASTVYSQRLLIEFNYKKVYKAYDNYKELVKEGVLTDSYFKLDTKEDSDHLYLSIDGDEIRFRIVDSNFKDETKEAYFINGYVGDVYTLITWYPFDYEMSIITENDGQKYLINLYYDMNKIELTPIKKSY